MMKRLTVAIIFLFILCGAYLGVANPEINAPFPLGLRFIFGAFGGFIIGLIVVGLLWIILWLARKFREKKPWLARLIGNMFFWLGNAIGIYMVGLAAYEGYAGAPTGVAGKLLGMGVFYLALGWSIRRVLTGQWRVFLPLFRRRLWEQQK
jgi:hypothetical protein